MACSGAYCNNHGTGCAGHRTSCATNRPLPASIPTSISGSALSADTINALKAYMNLEIDTYRQHRFFSSQPIISSVFTKNNPIDAASWDALGTVFFGITTLPAHESPLNNTFWAALVSKYEQIRQDCICNADCACNTVCACHNDCGCNY